MVNLLWLFFGITVSNLYKKKLESFDRYSRFIIIDMNLAKTDGLKLVNQTRCCVKIWFSFFLAKLPFNLVQNRNKSCSFAATLVPVPKETWPPKYVMFGHNNLCKKKCWSSFGCQWCAIVLRCSVCHNNINSMIKMEMIFISLDMRFNLKCRGRLRHANDMKI